MDGADTAELSDSKTKLAVHEDRVVLKTEMDSKTGMYLRMHVCTRRGVQMGV